MSKSYESISAEYAKFGAGDDDFADASDNALQIIQDEHGYENVTRESLEEGGKFYAHYLDLFADSLEGVRSEQGFRAN